MLKHLSNPTPYMILIAGLLLLDYVQNNAKREACPPTRSSQETVERRSALVYPGP